jgi:hypothetical protein
MIQAGMESISQGFTGKHFESSLYEVNNNKAYQAAKEQFKKFYIDLRPEDYGIDCDAYLTEEDYVRKQNPIFKLELEIRTHFDREIEYNQFNFFGRKQKLLTQEVTPFWLVYNPECTNCLLVPFPTILRGRRVVERLNLTSESSQYDEIVKVPKIFGSIGTDNLDRAILEYFISVANPMYQAIFGADYEAFDINNLTNEDVRQLARIANSAYRNIFTIKDNPAMVLE